MSGGSWDYFYGRLEDVASRLQCERDPLRKAFGAHLQKCAKALHDIEWVDSCDYSPGDEVEAIKAVLGSDGPAFPTYAEMHKALDDLHIVCECATMPEVETWYRGDAFAKEARQRAIDVLCRHTYAEREREMLIGFREAVRRIAAKPIDSSDMMDEIEHLLSLLPNKSAQP